MEQLKTKYEFAKQAIKTLEQAAKDYREALKTPLNYHIMDQATLVKYLRDATIQRFEYSFDVTWKYAKLYLEKELGVKFEQIGPAIIFRQCLKSRVLSESDVEQALEMIEDRNLTSHTYHEATAERVISSIPKYVTLLKHILHETNVSRGSLNFF